MLDIKYRKSDLIITDGDKNEISFNIEKNQIILDGFNISYSGEYEKSGILVEVKKYGDNLYYNFLIEKKRLVIITQDIFDLKEEILSFFGDVDILIIIGTKEAAKVFESIEAKLVIPYGESKDMFLHTLGQNVEEVNSYKIKGDFSLDSTEFVNLI
ncbi:MAG: hypothetical protein Q9M94_04870 [Candidatus Gracilibacteria bacterium]|nr:hypothetical protein [Candidatus Gracilibacteria bacterium]MDQ7023301.1 hypothetical protein [Candidatus Gracilibacteria bacterium]